MPIPLYLFVNNPGKPDITLAATYTPLSRRGRGGSVERTFVRPTRVHCLPAVGGRLICSEEPWSGSGQAVPHPTAQFDRRRNKRRN